MLYNCVIQRTQHTGSRRRRHIYIYFSWILLLLLFVASFPPSLNYGLCDITTILFFFSKLPLLCFILMSQKMCTYFVHGFSGYFSVLCIYIFLRFSQDRIDKLTVINSSSWQAVTVRTAVVEPLLNDDLKITLLSLR